MEAWHKGEERPEDEPVVKGSDANSMTLSTVYTDCRAGLAFEPIRLSLHIRNQQMEPLPAGSTGKQFSATTTLLFFCLCLSVHSHGSKSLPLSRLSTINRAAIAAADRDRVRGWRSVGKYNSVVRVDREATVANHRLLDCEDDVKGPRRTPHAH